jgi:hypothetical protein
MDRQTQHKRVKLIILADVQVDVSIPSQVTIPYTESNSGTGFHYCDIFMFKSHLVYAINGNKTCINYNKLVNGKKYEFYNKVGEEWFYSMSLLMKGKQLILKSTKSKKY